MKQLEFAFPDTTHTFADFFCGCGGFSLGFIQAGLKCVSAMDNAVDACHTFWHNLCYQGWSHLWVDPENEKLIGKIRKWESPKHWLFPKGVPDQWLQVSVPMPCLNLFCMSIMDIDPEQWMEMCGVRKGDIKIFVGGPPCQGFSPANSNRTIGDERNQLPLRMIYYAKVCQPDYVLIENVPGIISFGKKEGEKEGPFVHWIRNAFEEAGYHMEYKIHNMADYGVPQRRRRVLFFAVQNGVADFSLPEKTHGLGLEPHVNVMEAIGNLPPISAGQHYKGEAYGIEKRKGYVICPGCLRYVKEDRTHCQICGESISNPIRGGVFRIPGFATLLDCGNDIPEKYVNGMRE